jgi:hypothetical protein
MLKSNKDVGRKFVSLDHEVPDLCSYNGAAWWRFISSGRGLKGGYGSNCGSPNCGSPNCGGSDCSSSDCSSSNCGSPNCGGSDCNPHPYVVKCVRNSLRGGTVPGTSSLAVVCGRYTAVDDVRKGQ